MKRALDLICAFILLVAISPLMLFIGLMIGILHGRPVIFKQQRPGLFGKPFYLYKFRTMTAECDQRGKLLPDDRRLTSLGKCLRKYSLDELPQLINVLKGELSFVGPRPLLMEYLPLYTPEQAKRHEVKPGITGWAQVNGRNAISWEEKFELDVWYVENQSFFLDVKIICLTFVKVIRSEGIQQPGHATTEKFKGSKPEVREG